MEVAFDCFMRKAKLQYCSQAPDRVGKFYGGHCRAGEDAAPEYGAADNTLCSVCSD